MSGVCDFHSVYTDIECVASEQLVFTPRENVADVIDRTADPL